MGSRSRHQLDIPFFGIVIECPYDIAPVEVFEFIAASAIHFIVHIRERRKDRIAAKPLLFLERKLDLAVEIRYIPIAKKRI